MDTTSNTLIISLDKYLTELEYLAKENKTSLKNFLNVCILDNLYEWSFSLEVPEWVRQRILTIMDTIITRDTTMVTNSLGVKKINGVLTEIFNKNLSYKNVNIPQRYEQSGRIYDEKNYNLIDLNK